MNPAHQQIVRTVQSPSSRWKERLSDLPLVNNHVSNARIKLLVDGSEFLPEMVRVIDSARETLSFQFLNIEADEGGMPIAEALIRAAQRGVRVQGMFDGLTMALETNGRWSFWPTPYGRTPEVRQERARTSQMLARMRGAGVEIAMPFPSWKNRFTLNHRKSIIADNAICWMGGFNPTHHNLEWHEVSCVVEGEISVQVQKLYNQVALEEKLAPFDLKFSGRTDYLDHAQRVLVACVSNDPRNGASVRNFLKLALDRAESSVRVENAYFSDPASIRALQDTARRGVLVQLIVPERSNHPSVEKRRNTHLRALLESGVEVYLYQGMTHAKLMSIDDALVSIGSANFTTVNLEFERELNLVILDETGTLAKDMRERIFDRDIHRSKRVVF